MKLYKYILVAATIALASCSNEWDDHYNRSSQVSDTNLMEMMQADPDLSTFAKMAEIAGYDQLLSSSQTFTVFAPVNSALADIDLSDVELVRRTVLNHISRFNCPVTQGTGSSVKMYNGKRFSFDGSTFGGAVIKSADVVAKNGVLHTLADRIPYAYNLREYAKSHDNTTSLAAFLERFDVDVLDQEASRPIGIDANGATVYDSVMIPFNPILQHEVYGLGDIANEDSIFTMIIPTDRAWKQAYARISPYFTTYNADKAVADSIADLQTSLAIVSDLVYRLRGAEPTSMASVTSTSGSVITNIADLFGSAEKINASNGTIYLADVLNYDNTMTWNKQIEVEAEEQSNRTPGVGTTLYTRTVSSDQLHADEISNLSYIEVVGNTTSRNPGVTFSIPNVLAGEYDIYASFVPAVTADPTVTEEKTKLQFTLTYMDATGKNKSQTFKSNDYVTDPTEMTLMKIATFTFPVADFYDNLWAAQEGNILSAVVPVTKLNVVTNVSNSEFNSGAFVRQFRIDNVIFVPVKK